MKCVFGGNSNPVGTSSFTIGPKSFILHIFFKSYLLLTLNTIRMCNTKPQHVAAQGLRENYVGQNFEQFEFHRS